MGIARHIDIVSLCPICQCQIQVSRQRLTVIADSMGLFLYDAVCQGTLMMPALEDAGFGNEPYSVIGTRELSYQ